MSAPKTPRYQMDVSMEDIEAASVNAQPGGLYGPPKACWPYDHAFITQQGQAEERCANCGLTRAEAADFDA